SLPGLKRCRGQDVERDRSEGGADVPYRLDDIEVREPPSLILGGETTVREADRAGGHDEGSKVVPSDRVVPPGRHAGEVDAKGSPRVEGQRCPVVTVKSGRKALPAERFPFLGLDEEKGVEAVLH